MKIVVDSDIPFMKGVLDPWFEVTYSKGSQIDYVLAKDAIALVVRTRTRCDMALLSGSSVKAIFTATIGMDHIDLDYCNAMGIEVFNAAGCNAGGVMQYVITAIFEILKIKEERFKDKKIGIIGAGSVGERVARFLERAGMEVMRCDPPKSLSGNGISYYNLETVLDSCNIISLHLPLDSTTRNMCDREFLQKLKQGSYLINTSRGEVVAEQDLLRQRSRLGALVLDVWANEPQINLELLGVCDIATPHIAGYSYEGKLNATLLTVKNIGTLFGIEELSGFGIPTDMAPRIETIEYDGKSPESSISNVLCGIYPIMDENLLLKSDPGIFESLRINYKFRREFQTDLPFILKCFLQKEYHHNRQITSK
jgi:erythronate-4-phosphate dehydrogenase